MMLKRKKYYCVNGIFLFVLCLSFLTDMVCQQRTHVAPIVKWGEMLGCVFKGCPTYYCAMKSVVDSGMAVLFAIITIFFSMNMAIIELSKKKCFGLYRSELQIPTEYKYIRFLQYSSYALPVIMILFLTLQLYLCVYIVLFYGYFNLLIYFWYYIGNFSEEYEQDIVILSILELYKEYESSPTRIRVEYEAVLSRISQYVRSENAQKNAWGLLDKLCGKMDWSGNSSYYFTISFYRKIFMGLPDSSFATDICKWKLNGLVEVDGAFSDEWTITWTMLVNLFEDSDECEIASFLEWVSDDERRHVECNTEGKAFIHPSSYQMQSALSLILLEEWLKVNADSGYCNSLNKGIICKVWEHGRCYLKADHVQKLEQFVDEYAQYDPLRGEKLKEALDYLQNPEDDGITRSLVRALINMEGNTYEG